MRFFDYTVKVILSFILIFMPLAAQARTLIRDADIEQSLARVAQPILQAAGLPGSTKIYVIADTELNAFVVNTQAIFIHSGLLTRFSTAAPIQAVIAHEAAHIANGHISSRAGHLGAANTAAQLGLVLAAIAGASGNASAGVGLALGTSSAATRQFFAHTRAEEASADQSALRYMAAAGVPPSAALEVFNLFRGQEALSPTHQDVYVRTHPLTRDRMRAIEAYAAVLSVKPADTTVVDYWYARAIGKLSAFTNAPSWTLRRVGSAKDEVSTLRRAIAYHRQPAPERALAEIDQLITMRPNDGYYQELKGQILLESRQFPQAVTAYRRAVALEPREPLIQAGLGRALLAVDSQASNQEALRVLDRARARDPINPILLRDLALAHARAGQNGLASVTTAERYAVIGRVNDARIHAERAVNILPRGSSGWLRAEDVLAAVRSITR